MRKGTFCSVIHRRRTVRPSRRIAGSMMLAGLMACSDAALTTPPLDPEQIAWKLTLNHRAVNLSVVPPYDTVQLVAVPQNPFGEPIEGLPAVTFRTLYGANIEVTPDGKVTARKAISEASVIATLVVGNLTVVDTVLIRVTNLVSPPLIDSLRFDRSSGDTVQAKIQGDKVPPYRNTSITVRIVNAIGAPVSGLLVSYWTSDSTTAFMARRTGVLSLPKNGPVTLYTETTAYGVTRRDSIPCIVSGPYGASFAMGLRTPKGTTQPEVYFTPERVTIKAGGMVFWHNGTDTLSDVTFENPAGAGPIPLEYPLSTLTQKLRKGEAGNIAPWVHDRSIPIFLTYRGRVFPTPGLYRFYSSQFNTSGLIEVTP